MDTNRIVSVLRYLISPEDTILTGRHANPGGMLQVMKAFVCLAGALGAGLALSMLR